MKRRKLSKEAGALVPTAAVAVPATRTQKKKNTATTSAKQNLHLSDIDEHQERNRMHRTNEWIAKRAAIEEALIVSADPVILWPGFQTQESEDNVDEEGSEEDVDSEDEELDEIDEETMLGREGESQEHEEEGTAD